VKASNTDRSVCHIIFPTMHKYINKIAKLCVVILFMSPYIASASATMYGPTQYACDVSPSSFCVSQKFSVGVSVSGSPTDDLNGFGCSGGPMEFWSVMVNGTPSTFYPTTQKSGVFFFDFPVGTAITDMSIACSYLGDVNNAEGNNPSLFLYFTSAETRNQWVDMVLMALTDLSINLLFIFAYVIGIVLGVLLFKLGVRWILSSVPDRVGVDSHGTYRMVETTMWENGKTKHFGNWHKKYYD